MHAVGGQRSDPGPPAATRRSIPSPCSSGPRRIEPPRPKGWPNRQRVALEGDDSTADRWACREIYRAGQEAEIRARRRSAPDAPAASPRLVRARGWRKEKQGVRGCTRVACDLTCGRVNALLDRVRICLGAWSSRSTNPGHCRNQRLRRVPAPALALGWSVHQPGEGIGRSSRLLYWGGVQDRALPISRDAYLSTAPVFCQHPSGYIIKRVLFANVALTIRSESSCLAGLAPA